MVKREDIEEIVSDVINDFYGINTKCSIIKSSPYYAQALEMSEKYGLKLSKCTKTQLRFKDEGHVNPQNNRITSTELRFDDMLMNKHIDFTNENEDIEEGVYSIDTILGYYDNMPSNLKNYVGLMDFVDTNDPNHSTVYDPNLRRENVVYITNDAYIGKTYYNTDTHNLERIMAHEMGHCMDYGQLNSEDKSFIKKVYEGDESIMNQESLDWFKSVVLPKTHVHSGNGGFSEAVHHDAEDKGVDVVDVIPSTYAKMYYYDNEGDVNELGEHFAETVSMVSFRDKVDKGNARITTGSPILASLGIGDELDYDKYMGDIGSMRSVGYVEGLLFND